MTRVNRKINHRDLEQLISQPCDCNDHLQLKIAGYYSTNNKIVIAARRGVDEFFVAARGPKSDLSEAIVLDSRYLVIGDIEDIDERIFKACMLSNTLGQWLEIPNQLYVTRLLIAGASRVIVVVDALPSNVAQTPEYKRAKIEGRLIEIV